MVFYDIDGEIEQRYRILRHIGSGAYGVVWCAMDTHTGKHVALKKIFDAFGNQQDAQRTYREVMLLSSLTGVSNVVVMCNVIRSVSDNDLYVVFEIAETDLTQVLRNVKLASEHQRFLMYQLVKAVAQLHAMCVIHRDLKPSNVLVYSDCTIKVGDFGLARSFLPENEAFQAHKKDEDSLHFTDYIATRWYRSPEILLRSARYDTSIDMWAIGCIMCEVLVGQPFFSGSSTTHQLQLIVNALGDPTDEDIQSFYSEEAWPFPNHHQPAKEPLHKTLEKYDPMAVDFAAKCLVFNPRKRLTAKKALQHEYLAQFFSNDDLLELDRLPQITLPVPDETLASAATYKKEIYELIEKKFRYQVSLA